MSKSTRLLARPGHPCAFTIVEILVTIAIIATLAALVFSALRPANRQKLKPRITTELAQVSLAIDAYKAKLGHYPPDNPGTHGSAQTCNHACNQLYFELLGCTLSNNTYRTLDGTAQIGLTDFPTAFPPTGGSGVSGIINCSRGAGKDEGGPAIAFLTDLKPDRVGAPAGGPWKYLVCSVPWPATLPPIVPGNNGLNPIRYNSSSPTHNPTTYDLWIDVVIEGKINRFSNWSSEPQVVDAPL